MAADGSIKISTDLDTGGLKSAMDKLGNFVKTGTDVIAKALAATSVAFGALVTQSLQAVGHLQQSVGGVETLFKDSADIVIKNASKAYQTAGVSAVDYMDQVTSFAASLLQSLGGDTAEAAKVADMAIIDMADNSNKMGTSIDRIQFAYQGFSRQNFTMLDNLKLGYQGTKDEMQRLLEDAEKLSGKKYDISNLTDIFEAIHVIQTELGITGTTAEEAMTTLEGSIGMAKAAFANFLSGAPETSAQEVIDTFSNAADIV